ncbi:hypothetical protein J7K24_00660 [bacterium]|nr:hypothetical protein [bacterium]
MEIIKKIISIVRRIVFFPLPLKIFVIFVIFHIPLGLLWLICRIKNPTYGCFGNEFFFLYLSIPGFIVGSILAIIIHFVRKKANEKLFNLLDDFIVAFIILVFLFLLFVALSNIP